MVSVLRSLSLLAALNAPLLAGCGSSSPADTSVQGAAGMAAANGGTSGEGGANTSPAGAGGTPTASAGMSAVGGAMPVAGAPSHSDGGIDPIEADADAPMPRTFVYVSGYDPQISVLALDVDTPALEPLSVTDAAPGAEPTFLAFSPNKHFAYAIDEQLNGPVARVIAFAIDPATGALTEINHQDTGATIGAHVAVHPSGQWVLAANYGGGSVSVFAVRGDGGLQPASTPVTAGGQAHQVAFDATGNVAFVPCVMAQHLAVFDFSAGI
ncbi:MAG TPA: beta-propeller fold lactonase family protein, partial [Polyangiaceae bacterium]|nr:beta-propeller fold lactonase family protein [Polyangiaceae bacterium]